MRVIFVQRFVARISVLAAGSALLLSGCAATVAEPQSALLVSPPGEDVSTTVRIPQISACNDSATPVRIDPSRPVVLIVHGCFSSAGRFKALADVFNFNGQQALCFNYNDRDSLTRSSAELVGAIDRLSRDVGVRQLTLMGHSQGGLVARRAVIQERGDALRSPWPAIDLVTISAPFAGIRASAHCGSRALRWLSLGLTVPICQMVTGSKWSEIPATAAFIQKPGNPVANVRSHLKIVTDERGSCRAPSRDNRCLESDFVFSLAEQYQARVDAFARLDNVEVMAGHVEIVGDADRAPSKLIALLQQRGILAPVSSDRMSDWRGMLSRLYSARTD